MRIHLIAIGGAAMHNLAIALQYNHHTVTGSDDEIYEPSRSRLLDKGLLPAQMGWSSDRITRDIDAIILGMHARPDNPELLKSQELGLKIYSYPAFIYEHAINKQRFVIAGSHGKTTTTGMLLHVTQKLGLDTDFLVGAQLEGFETMVRLSNANKIIIEGDEYLSSPIDRRPKIFHYKPQVAIITGIAWDHVNVFPTFEEYLRQFELFLDTLDEGAKVIYFEGDKYLTKMMKARPHLIGIPYNGYETAKKGETLYVLDNAKKFAVKIFGNHNMQNLQAANLMAREMGIVSGDFLTAISDFTGAAKRLELLWEKDGSYLFKDFAHAPSKVRATVSAVRERFPNHKLIGVVELHTFSSLNKTFLPEYEGALDPVDIPVVFYQKHTLEMKGLPMIYGHEIKDGFKNENLLVVSDKEALKAMLRKEGAEEVVFLMMSSGTFGGMDLMDLQSL